MGQRKWIVRRGAGSAGGDQLGQGPQDLELGGAPPMESLAPALEVALVEVRGEDDALLVGLAARDPGVDHLEAVGKLFDLGRGPHDDLAVELDVLEQLGPLPPGDGQADLDVLGLVVWPPE